MSKCLLTFLILCLLVIVNGQSDSLKKQNQYFKFEYDNDVFLQTDQYYTQGIYIECANQLIEKIPLNYLLLRAKNWNLIENKISIRQKCYTPTNISNPDVISGDRPYAGTLEFEQSKVIYKLKNKVTSAVSLGMMGQCAFCEEEQKFIHKLTNNAEPQGWRHQISNTPIVNYKLNYSYLLFNSNYFQNDIYIESQIGTLLNTINAGSNFNLGRGFLSLANKNKFSLGQKKFSIFLASQHLVSYVLYNSLLQGSFINKSFYSLSVNEIERFVIRNSININLCYKKMLLSMGCTFITKEIKTGNNHAWGNVGFILLH